MRTIILRQITKLNGSVRQGIVNPEDIEGSVFRLADSAITTVTDFYRGQDVPLDISGHLELAGIFRAHYQRSESFPLPCLEAVGPVLDRWVEIETRITGRHPAEQNRYFGDVMAAFRALNIRSL